MTDTAVRTDELAALPIDALRPHPNNRAVSDDDVDDIVASAATHGILEPLLVRPLEDRPGEFEIIAGVRRHVAARVAGLENVPCIVRTGLSDRDVVELRLVENFARRDLHPLDEAEIFFELKQHGATQTEIGALIATAGGKTEQSSQPTVSKRLSLLALSDRGKADFRNGILTVRQAEALASLCRKHPDRADTVLDTAERNPDLTESEIRRQLQQVKAAEERAERVAELEAEGLTVVDTYGFGNGENVPISNFGMAAEDHRGLPCHAVFVGDGARDIPVCTQPITHRTTPEERPSATESADDWRARQAERQAERDAQTAAREQAATDRLATIQRTIAGTRSKAYALDYLVTQVIADDDICSYLGENIGRALGIVDDDTDLDTVDTLLRSYAAAGGDHVPALGLALAWALAESYLRWSGVDEAQRAAVDAHYALLVENGYELTDHDRQYLEVDEPADQPTPDEATPPSDPAVNDEDEWAGYDERGFEIRPTVEPIPAPEGSCAAAGHHYNLPGNATGIACPVCKAPVDTDAAGRVSVHEAA